MGGWSKDSVVSKTDKKIAKDNGKRCITKGWKGLNHIEAECFTKKWEEKGEK